MKARARIKRSDCLAYFPSEGGVEAVNYLTGIRLRVPVPLLEVLDRLTTWTTTEAVVRTFNRSTPASVRQLLRLLEQSTFIVREGSKQAVREHQLAPWHAWGAEARLFHFATKLAHRIAPESDEAALVRSLLKRGAIPPATKTYRGRRRIGLPKHDERTVAELPQVLLRRRTTRRFSQKPVTLRDVALLMQLTWGFTSSRPWPGMGRVPLKTSPSGGARHPIEVYLLPLRVQGLARRVHYYHPAKHSLIDLGVSVTPAEVQRFCGHQPWTRNAAALFVMTAVIPRVTWRYRKSRAYRVLLLEAGHFCQTFCLLATWLNLAAFSTAALDDEYLEQRLGIDGSRETVLYAAGIGSQPKVSSASADRAVRGPRRRPTRP